MSLSAKISASAPGKLILLGEYAVLEGAPALVTAVNRRAMVSLSPSPDQLWKLTAPQLGLEDFVLGTHGAIPNNVAPKTQKVLGLFTAVMQCVFEDAGQLEPQHINIDTGAFFHGDQKLGIGSSAAVAVALTGALLTALKQDVSSDALFKLAANAHQEAQGGVGSNADIAASVYGGTFVHQIGAAPTPIKLPNKLSIQPVFTGRAASTPNFINSVYDLREQAPEVFSQHMLAMTHLAEKGCDACRQDNAPALINLAGEYHHAMQNLGVHAGADIISDSHKLLHTMATELGFGYKPSGAGGGDIGLLFYQPPIQLDAIEAGLGKSGFDAIALEQCAPGFKVM